MNVTQSHQILILEDDPLIALDLEQTLTTVGDCNVIVLSSAAEAQEYLALHRPSLAIVDVRMRDGTSASVAEQLHVQRIPFVVCSGLELGDLDEVFHHGVWIPKPSDRDRLLDAVTRSGTSAAKPKAYGS